MYSTICLKKITGFILFCSVNLANAATWVMQNNDDLVGEIQYVNAQSGDTLYELGLRYDIGLVEMKAANPGIDPDRHLAAGTKLTIPSFYVLPAGPRRGLVINLAEYRLYYFPNEENVVITMPVGIGRQGWNTPVGTTKVIAKHRDPVWHPTAKLKDEANKNGAPVPDEFPSGEDNPLGRYALRLGWSTYLIHGTNRHDGIGSQVSAGCLRMTPEDIEYLFEFVAVGTPVRIINEPVKIGHINGNTYIEVHASKKTHSRLAASKFKDSAIVSREQHAPTGIPRKIN